MHYANSYNGAVVGPVIDVLWENMVSDFVERFSFAAKFELKQCYFILFLLSHCNTEYKFVVWCCVYVYA